MKGCESVSNDKVYFCIGCGQPHPRSNFYKSYTHANGVYPFCKTYIKDEVYNKDDTINVERFKDILRQANAPFLISEMEGALGEEKREPVGAYFSRINMQQNRGLTWEHSTFECGATNDNADEDEIDSQQQDYFDDDNFEPTREMWQRWGKNYSPVKIYYLEQFYQDMHTTHTIVTPQHEKALVLICKLQLKMDDALEKDDMVGFAKAHSEYQKLLTSSGLRPIDKIGGAEASGIRSFSQVFEEIEKEGFIKPAPIEENQDIVDKTIQYIMNYTLKLLNQQVLTEPPFDTPKADDSDD